MKKNQVHITVFEHSNLWIDRGEQRLSIQQLEKLQAYNAQNDSPYYSLIYHGIHFHHYVGVLLIDELVIEILPKLDKENNTILWRNTLISMLLSVKEFNVFSNESTQVKIKPNSVLHLYLILLIDEVEKIVRKGLIKQYHSIEGNHLALKGKLLFRQQITKNSVHPERFYTKSTKYDTHHLIHNILYSALSIVKEINNDTSLNSRIAKCLLSFEKFNKIRVSKEMFDSLKINRKSRDYQSALEIAKIILLNYHPDIRIGAQKMLALMFDMNLLWEKYVYVALQKKSRNKYKVIAQHSKKFWKASTGYPSRLQPDIILTDNSGECIILDTKWKVLKNNNPSINDLRQMYSYMKLYKAHKVALIYPSMVHHYKTGNFFDFDNSLSNQECSILSIALNENNNEWQEDIYHRITEWAFT